MSVTPGAQLEQQPTAVSAGLIETRASPNNQEKEPNSETNKPESDESPTCANRRYPLRNRKPKVTLSMKSTDIHFPDPPFEPRNYKEATQCDEAHLWGPSMVDEFNSHQTNGTWILTRLPEGRKAIGTRWVYKIKPGHLTTPARHKSRFVAKGYSQIEGVDFQETYAPVVKYTSLRILLSYAAVHDWEMAQLDIKTAFLYGLIDEELYIEQPEGFIKSGEEKLVCKLVKCIYGLKQASRVWNKKFNEFLIKYGLKRCLNDFCVYIHRTENKFLIVCIWTDDGFLLSNDKPTLANVMTHLEKEFEIRILPTDRFVGMEIARNRKKREIFVNQSAFARTMLSRFNAQSYTPKSVPANSNVHLSGAMSPNTEWEKQEMEKIPYRSAIGCLLYLSTVSRPDLSLIAGRLSRYCENPGREHWTAMQQVFSYIAGTINHGLCYNQQTSITGYTDSDWAEDRDTYRSTTGFIFTLNGGPVSWCSRRQKTVASSSCQAEYMAANETAKEAIWIRNLQDELGLSPSTHPVPIHCDNQGAVKVVRDPVFHSRMKHIPIIYHETREFEEAKLIKMLNIGTKEQLADIFTKAMDKSEFQRCRDMIGVLPLVDN